MNVKKEVQTEYFEEIGSTNDYAKQKRSERRDLIVTAKRQTGGRGTKGRSFSSNEGGVYLSKLSFYDGLPAKDAFKIMQGAAAAVCETLAFYGFSPKIKWPNDVYVNGKKICGILIENAFSEGYVSSSVVGIGLNVRNVLPAELTDIATTMQAERGERFSVDEVRDRLIGFLTERNINEKYAGYLGWLGEEATLLVGEETVRAKLLGVDETGGLIARTDGGEKRFAAAEVSLRI